MENRSHFSLKAISLSVSSNVAIYFYKAHSHQGLAMFFLIQPSFKKYLFGIYYVPQKFEVLGIQDSYFPGAYILDLH